MDPIPWDLSSPPLPWELDYDKRAVPTSWAEEASPQRAIPFLLSLSVLVASWGVIGNGMILWHLGFHMKRARFAVYLLNITAANVLLLLCHILNTVGQWLFSLDSNTVFLIFTQLCGSVRENVLVAMSLALCLSGQCPGWCHGDRPKHASAIVSSLTWGLTSLLSGTGYLLCRYPSSSNGCQGFLRGSQVWLFLLYLVTLTLLFCNQCSRCQCGRYQRRRCQCPKCPSLRVPAVLIMVQLLLHSLPFVIAQFSSEFTVTTLQNEDDFNLSRSESDATTFAPEENFDVLLSCVEISTEPFIYFFMTCCKKRRGGESFRVLLQRTLLEEGELENGPDMVSGSPLRTQDRTGEEPRRGGAAP